MPADPTNVAEALDAAAITPASVSSDAGSFTQQPIPDLIALDRYKRAQAAASKPAGGLRFTKLVPPSPGA